MRTIKPKLGPWTYLPASREMSRSGETQILLNYQKHGSERGDTVEKLIACLQTLPSKSIVWIEDDECTGLMSICVDATETREATALERLEYEKAMEAERDEIERRHQARLKAAPIIAGIKKRTEDRRLRKELDIIDLSLAEVRSQANDNMSDAERKDLLDDIDTLNDERVKLLVKLNRL